MLKRFAEQWFGIKNKQQAQHAKRRFAILYAFLGWNSFGIGFYLLTKERLPEDSAERRKAYGKLTGTSSNVHVYQVTGMTVKKEFQMVYDRLAQAEENKQTEEKQTAVTTQN